MTSSKYRQFNLLLDAEDEVEAQLIKYLELKKGKKMKNSYSSILKRALKLLKEIEQ